MEAKRALNREEIVKSFTDLFGESEEDINTFTLFLEKVFSFVEGDSFLTFDDDTDGEKFFDGEIDTYFVGESPFYSGEENGYRIVANISEKKDSLLFGLVDSDGTKPSDTGLRELSYLIKRA